MSPNTLSSGQGNASWLRIVLAVAVCLSMVLPAAADPALQEGLIAYWPFDDTPGSAVAVDVIKRQRRHSHWRKFHLRTDRRQPAIQRLDGWGDRPQQPVA